MSENELKEARELIEEVRKPLMNAGRTGVVDPELAHKLGMAQKKIVNGDPNITVEVNDRGER